MNPQTPGPAPQNNASWRAKLTSPRGMVVLVLVVVLLFVAAAILARQDDQPAPATPDAQVSQATAEVSITTSGLTPATINIEAGTQLTWKNDDQAPHQIAADPHPLNDSIPGFDNDQLLQPGDSFSFTFETPGTYTVHDHLNPLNQSWQGTVVVE